MRYWTHLEVPGIRGENFIFHPKTGFFVTWVGPVFLYLLFGPGAYLGLQWTNGSQNLTWGTQ